MSSSPWSDTRAWSSPLLKGGRALQHTVHSMVQEQNRGQEYDVVKGNRPGTVRRLFSAPAPSQSQISALEQYVKPLREEDLRFETKLQEVHSKLADHEEKLEQTSGEMLAIRESTSCSVRKVRQLESHVQSQDEVLQKVLQQTHRALEQQRALLSTQHSIIQKIHDSSNNSTHWLSDSVHVAVALYALSTPSVRYAVWWAVRKLTPGSGTRRRQQGALVWIIRVVMFAQMLKLTRAVDERIGMTRGISGIVSTCVDMFTSGFSRFSKLGSTPLSGFSQPAVMRRKDET